MKNIVSKMFATFLCLFMAAALIAVSVQARSKVDTEKKASLTLNYACANADFSIYKVGDISALGNLSLSGDFSGYSVSLNNDQDGWRELATTLKGYVARDGISPAKSGKTGTDKKLSFSDLPVGLYLVIGEKSVEISGSTKTVYTPSEFMICLPNIVDEDSDWVYDVTAKPKYETTTEELIDIEALKVWEDTGSETSRPTSIDVQLMKGSEVYDTQTLSESNSWKYTWNELSAESEWSVVEKTVPTDYTVDVSKTGSKYVITNTVKPQPTTTEPTTSEPTSIGPTQPSTEPTTAEPTSIGPTQLSTEPTTAEPTSIGPTQPSTEPTTAEPTSIGPTQPSTEPTTTTVPDTTTTAEPTTTVTEATTTVTEPSTSTTVTTTTTTTTTTTITTTTEPVTSTTTTSITTEPTLTTTEPSTTAAPTESTEPTEPTATVTTSVTSASAETASVITEAPTQESTTEDVDITPTYPDDEDPDLPQTGMLWWPVGVLSAGGMGMLLAGIIRKRKDDDK